MKVDIQPGKYVLAVSGGVDSMTLLDILSKESTLELVLAHFNHGLRTSSSIDEHFVRETVSKRGLPLEIGYGHLGEDASEGGARKARYRFLREIKQKHEAIGIITAHHQDDLIETAMINIIRGTGPKGLIAISSNKDIKRPLLGYSKKQVLNYAFTHKLQWVEDPSNKDNKYLRNYVRNVTLARLKPADRQIILDQIKKIEILYRESESVIANLSHDLLVDELTLNRQAFIALPREIATSFLVFWLNKLEAGSLDKKTVLRLANSLKTAQAGSLHEVKNGSRLLVGKKQASFRR